MVFNFFKKKEPVELPWKFAMVTLTREAKEMGVDDDANRIIQIFRNGRVIETIPYSEEIIKSLAEVNEISIVDEREISQGEEFDFIDIPEFGETELRR